MTAFYFNIQKLGSTFTLDYDSMYMYVMSIFLARVSGKQNLKDID